MRTYSEDKIKGTLYGLAIGDAMGVTTEFLPQTSIKKKFKKRSDIIGKGRLKLPPGEVTDPTQIAFCVCEALIKTSPYRGKSNYPDRFLTQCCQSLVDWQATSPVDMEECCKNVINNCKGQIFQKWMMFSFNPETTGNSNLFRCIPMVLTRHRADIMVEQSRLTHNNSLCDREVRRFIQLLKSCLRNEEITTQVFSQLPPRHRHITYTIDSALYHMETTATFESAVMESIYHGGDTDAIAALTGALAGAMHGFQSIPQRWIDQLCPEVVNKIEHYCDFMK